MFQDGDEKEEEEEDMETETITGHLQGASTIYNNSTDRYREKRNLSLLFTLFLLVTKKKYLYQLYDPTVTFVF